MRRAAGCLIVFFLSSWGSSFGQSGKTPIIVASVALTNQTSGVPKTTLVTPANSAVYRVSAYISNQTDNTGSAWCLSLGWTDENGARTKTLQASTTYAPTWASEVFVARDLAGSALTYSTNECLGQSTLPYETFVTVERVQ
jgi:hypothetical protein